MDERNFIGLLGFRDNNTKVVVVNSDGKEFDIWNLYEITIHTYGYPQMNATINAIYTAYRKDTICDCFISSDGTAYIHKVIRVPEFVEMTLEEKTNTKLAKLYEMLPDFLKPQKQKFLN